MIEIARGTRLRGVRNSGICSGGVLLALPMGIGLGLQGDCRSVTDRERGIRRIKDQSGLSEKKKLPLHFAK